MLAPPIKTILTTLLIFFSLHSFAEKAPKSIDTLLPKLESWGSNKVLVEEVKKHNAQGLSLETIQARDKEWQLVSGVNDFMKEMMSNAAALELKKLEASMSFLFECFLMGDKGANIAMTNKTSDYWQGDEAKFTKSFNNAHGQIHVGDVEFDKSAQAYLVQISVPVKDNDSTIGAITIGVNLDDYEASLK